MLKRFLLASLLVSVIGLSLTVGVAHARGTTLVGVVTRVEPSQIEVRSDSQEAATVRLTAETDYLKWIMAKPWQQDIRTDARALHVGSRVHVDLGPGSQPTAQTVWVVVGRPGGVN
jgi:hypothetical protein